jgi:hypothetical protein
MPCDRKYLSVRSIQQDVCSVGPGPLVEDKRASPVGVKFGTARLAHIHHCSFRNRRTAGRSRIVRPRLARFDFGTLLTLWSGLGLGCMAGLGGVRSGCIRFGLSFAFAFALAVLRSVPFFATDLQGTGDLGYSCRGPPGGACGGCGSGRSGLCPHGLTPGHRPLPGRD